MNGSEMPSNLEAGGAEGRDEEEQTEKQAEEGEVSEKLRERHEKAAERLGKKLEKIEDFEPSGDIHQDCNEILELSGREDIYKKVNKDKYEPEEVLAGLTGMRDIWQNILRDPEEFNIEGELSAKDKVRKLLYKDVPEAELDMINKTINYYLEKLGEKSKGSSKTEGDETEFTAETHPEQASVEQLLQEDFKAQGVLEEILRRGDESDLEKLRQRSGLSEEQVERLKYYVEMRDDVVKKTKEEVQDRKEEKPKAAEKEMQLGTYKEAIEPQVKDAVFKLREKGYNTKSSGFGYPSRQLLSFKANDYLEQFDEKEDLQEELKQEGIELSFSPMSISFRLEEKFDIKKIKETWDKIADELPDLGEEASKVKHSNAKKFREEQKELFENNV